MKYKGKQPVVVVVGEDSCVLQEPCPHCHGGTVGSYDPTNKYLVGVCQYCRDGLIDTPMGLALMHHFGIFIPLNGSWKGKAGSSFFLPDGEWAKPTGTLHFYPDSWHKRHEYNFALCAQGGPRHGLISPEEGKEKKYHLCKNCLRIKKIRERGDPVIYG
jgi:hypothetical protein